MPIYKFFNQGNNIILENEDKLGEFVDITNNSNSKLMPKEAFISEKYRIKGGNIYIVRSDFIIDLSRRNHPHPNISALYYYYKNKHIIIIPSKPYCFYNNISIEPKEFSLFPGVNLESFVSLHGLK